MAIWDNGMGGCMLSVCMHASIVHTHTHTHTHATQRNATQNRHPRTAPSHAIDDAHAVGRTHDTHTHTATSLRQPGRKAAGRQGEE